MKGLVVHGYHFITFLLQENNCAKLFLIVFVWVFHIELDNGFIFLITFITSFIKMDDKNRLT